MIEIFQHFLEFFTQLPKHLNSFTQENGMLVYGLLFLIVFAETGLVVTPFLPGDSLLFAVGAVAANPESGLNVWIASVLLLFAAILGDTVNYWIGRKSGGWMMRKFPRIVKPEHIAKTNEFFVRYGGKTIIIARFVPIVRTFAPFVAGSGDMDYRRFMMFNVVGALLWVGSLVPLGYALGNATFTFFGYKFVVKEQFEIVVVAIIFISILPMIIEFIRAKLKKPAAPDPDSAG